MKNRIVIYAAISVIVIFVIVSGLSKTRSMPSYQGKTAEQWMKEVYTTNHPAATDAFRHMGTNAIPVLIQAFRKKDTIWSEAYDAFYRNLPALWRQHFARPARAQQMWIGAEVILVLEQSDKDYLAQEKKFVPELTRLMSDKANKSRSFTLPVLKMLVGPEDKECVPGLTGFLTEKDLTLRWQATDLLSQIGLAASEAVPALKLALSDPEAQMRLEAARALWIIAGETNLSILTLREIVNDQTTYFMRFRTPRESKYWALVYLHEINPADASLIPAFVQELQNPETDAHDTAVIFLQGYGEAARSAIPALKDLLLSNDSGISRRALDVLEKIDPAAAEKHID